MNAIKPTNARKMPDSRRRRSRLKMLGRTAAARSSIGWRAGLLRKLLLHVLHVAINIVLGNNQHPGVDFLWQRFASNSVEEFLHREPTHLVSALRDAEVDHAAADARKR